MNKVDVLPFKYLHKRDTLPHTIELSFSRTMAANIHPLPALMLHTSRRDALLLMWDWVSYLPQLTTKEPAELKGLCTLNPMQTGSTLLANNPKLCWILRVAPVCTPCCMLLRVVGSCCAKFETDQTFRYVQTDARTPNNVASVCTGLYGQQLISVSSQFWK